MYMDFCKKYLVLTMEYPLENACRSNGDADSMEAVYFDIHMELSTEIK
jgi:hypothetical protein